MSAGWKVGDLACFVGGAQREPGRTYSGKETPGRIRLVEGVVGAGTRLGLVLEGVRSTHPTGAYCASQWRKIVPDEPTACEEEFQTLLKLSKKRVSA